MNDRLQLPSTILVVAGSLSLKGRERGEPIPLPTADPRNCPDVSATLTSTAFDRSSSRWLGISDLIAEPEGPSFISRTVARSRVDRLRS
jgi:hypothetical protein